MLRNTVKMLQSRDFDVLNRFFLNKYDVWGKKKTASFRLEAVFNLLFDGVKLNVWSNDSGICLVKHQIVW